MLHVSACEDGEVLTAEADTEGENRSDASPAADPTYQAEVIQVKLHVKYRMLRKH